MIHKQGRAGSSVMLSLLRASSDLVPYDVQLLRYDMCMYICIYIIYVHIDIYMYVYRFFIVSREQHLSLSLLRCSPSLEPDRGTSLIRTSAPLGPYSRTMPRALWWSRGGALFLLSEVPLFHLHVLRYLHSCLGFIDVLSGLRFRGLLKGRWNRFNLSWVSKCALFQTKNLVAASCCREEGL